jgi:hypothetical protein
MDGEWTNEPFSRSQAWVDLILLARHKDGETRISGERYLIKRGCLIWSQKNLSLRWKWSRGRVKRFLDELRDVKHQIEHQNIRRSTHVKILNYDRYQSADGAPNDAPDSAPDESPNSAPDIAPSDAPDGAPNGHQIEHQTDTNKKDKNIKKDNNVKNDYDYRMPITGLSHGDTRVGSSSLSSSATNGIKKMSDSEIIDLANRYTSMQIRRGKVSADKRNGYSAKCRENWKSDPEGIESALGDLKKFNSRNSTYKKNTDPDVETAQRQSQLRKDFFNEFNSLPESDKKRYRDNAKATFFEGLPASEKHIENKAVDIFVNEKMGELEEKVNV